MKNDGFGRLRQVKRTDNQALVAEYRYNGLGHRLSWKYDTDGNLDVDGSDQTYFFVYDLKWRPVATYRGTDSNPKERFVFHNAGLAGKENSSYIDSVIMRDKDANTAWTAASDATLEERRYYVQNWRADVVALLTSGGVVSEWVRYSAYGEATVYPFVNGDYNEDGGVDGDDVLAFLTDAGAAAAAADVNRDESVDGDDTTAFYASYNNGWMSTAWTAAGGLPANAGAISVTSGNRIGYAGYQFDPATKQYHVRHRVYVPEMGRWTKRDPLGYVDGMSLYEYAKVSPTVHVDIDGRQAAALCVTGSRSVANWGTCTVSSGAVFPLSCQFAPTPPPPTAASRLAGIDLAVGCFNIGCRSGVCVITNRRAIFIGPGSIEFRFTTPLGGLTCSWIAKCTLNSYVCTQNIGLCAVPLPTRVAGSLLDEGPMTGGLDLGE